VQFAVAATRRGIPLRDAPNLACSIDFELAKGDKASVLETIAGMSDSVAVLRIVDSIPTSDTRLRLITTMPPWPGEEEAVPTDGHWEKAHHRTCRCRARRAPRVYVGRSSILPTLFAGLEGRRPPKIFCSFANMPYYRNER